MRRNDVLTAADLPRSELLTTTLWLHLRCALNWPNSGPVLPYEQLADLLREDIRCSRPTGRVPAPGCRRNQRQQLTCALVWPKSGAQVAELFLNRRPL